MNLAQKKPVLLPKKKITSLSPHNGHLSTTATFFCPQGGRYGDSSTKTRNPESGIRKRKRNTQSNINDRKLKNFTLHNLVQSKENLF